MLYCLTAPRNADVPVHLYEGRGNVTVEFVPSEVGKQMMILTTVNLNPFCCTKNVLTLSCEMRILSLIATIYCLC